MSRRSLPLAVVTMLLAGLASAAVTAAPASRCAGMADIEKVDKKMTLSSLPPDLKKACDEAFWTYLKSHDGGSFDKQYTAQAQIAMIKDVAVAFAELDAAAAAVTAKAAAIEKDVAMLKETDAAKVGAREERYLALDRIIAKEGEPLLLQGAGPQKEPVVKPGTSYAELYELYWKITGVKLISARASFTTTKGAPFTRQDMARLWDGRTNPGKGAYAAVDPKQGHELAAAWKKAHELLNEANMHVRGKAGTKLGSGTVAAAKQALKVDASLAGEKWKSMSGEAPVKEAQPLPTQGATQNVEAFRSAFETKTADEIFAGIKARQELKVDDPQHLDEFRAAELKEKYKGGKAEIRDNKIVYTIPGKDGKSEVISETPLPEKQTAEAGGELAKGVAQKILDGDPLSAKKAALVGAITGEPVGAEQKTGGPVGNLTGPTAGPKGFMDEAAAASCGSPLDLGKSKSELALEAREAKIAEGKAKNSAERQKLRKECEGGAKDADSALEKEQKGIRERHLKIRANPSLNADEIKADREAEGAELAQAEKAHAERIGKLQASCEERLKGIGYKSEVEKTAAADEKKLYDEVRAAYMEPKKGVPAQVEAAKAKYKKDKKALARKMTEEGVGGSTVEKPWQPGWIRDDQLYGEKGYFTVVWDKDPAKSESYKKMLAKLGIPAEGRINNNDLKDVSEVGELLEADLVAWYKAYVAQAGATRKAPADGKPAAPPAETKPGEKAKLKVDFDR